MRPVLTREDITRLDHQRQLLAARAERQRLVDVARVVGLFLLAGVLVLVASLSGVGP